MEEKSIIDYTVLTDEELVALAKERDDIALNVIFERYKKIVRDKSRSYFIAGGDRDDLIQEGMIGLFSAIVDFDETRNVKFVAFAHLCVERHILTAIRKASSKKNSPLNTSVSFPEAHEADSFSTVDSPEDIIVGRENALYRKRRLIENLSNFEKKIFNELLKDKNYSEIAEDLNKEKKSIDNAIQRIKRKMKKIDEMEF